MAEEDFRDIQASLAGDQDAFAALVQRYQRDIANLMWRFTRDADQCQELVQDVFVEAYFSLSGFRGKAPLLHWLRRIATRAGYRFWKRQSKRRQMLPLEGMDFAAEPAETDPASAAEVVHALLARLAPAERLVLTLQYLDQCSIQEIARRTGWTTAMVKMRAYRARKKLRKIAEKEGIPG